MTDSTQSTALAERHPLPDFTALTGTNIKTPAQLAERIRALQAHAFILSPMSAVAAIAPGYEITPVVVAIDPSVDAESGRGAEVYYQPSIHKKVKERGQWVPLEVSLNKYGLLRILGAVGVNVYPPRWLQDPTEKYLWICEVSGDVTEFDGRVRRLPAGTGSLDARDGSADIGEWTPPEWAKRVEVANAQRAKTPEAERWKVKPEPMDGGWTKERVMQVRKYGRQLAETKAMNRLARNLGVRQSYTIAELTAKPFVIMRTMFMPDMTNPRVAEMIAAVNLGARHLLYPGATAPQEVPELPEHAPVSHAHGEPALDGEVAGVMREPAERMQTASAPQGAEEVSFDEPAATAPDDDEVYVITKLLQQKTDGGARYFVETQAGVTLYTPDAALAKALHAAQKDGLARRIETERVVIAGQPYRQVLQLSAAGPKL